MLKLCVFGNEKDLGELKLIALFFLFIREENKDATNGFSRAI